MNWFVIAAIMAALYLGAFIICVAKRRWTIAGLLAGLVQLPLAALVSVAPVRGWADPDYVGFVFGLLHVPAGPLVTLVAGAILVAATYSACVAVLGLRGKPMLFVASFDALIVVNIMASLLHSFIYNPASLRLELGEYLQLGPLGALLVHIGLLGLPLTLSTIWAWRRR